MKNIRRKLLTACICGPILIGGCDQRAPDGGGAAGKDTSGGGDAGHETLNSGAARVTEVDPLRLGFEKAVRGGEVDVLRAFIEDNGDWADIEEARKKLEAMEFQVAASEDRIEGYTEFLHRYPESEHSLKARIAVERLWLSRACEENTIEGYREFLERFPDSRHRKMVAGTVEDMEYGKCRKEANMAGYERFLELYPESKHADAVRRALAGASEGPDWAAACAAGTGAAYHEYYLKHPGTQRLKVISGDLRVSPVLTMSFDPFGGGGSGRPPEARIEIFMEGHPEISSTLAMNEAEKLGIADSERLNSRVAMVNMAARTLRGVTVYLAAENGKLLGVKQKAN